MQVWREDSYKLSRDSLIQLQTHGHVGKCLSIQLPYGDAERTIPIDAIVYDKDNRLLTAYNVKRGNGAYDAAKTRLLQGELLRTGMLLKSYGEQLGLNVEVVRARVIFYYGLKSIGEPFAVIGDDLDEHFQFDVRASVEAVNSYYRSRLHYLIEHP
jgi:hypothetical protein